MKHPCACESWAFQRTIIHIAHANSVLSLFFNAEASTVHVQHFQIQRRHPHPAWKRRTCIQQEIHEKLRLCRL